MRAITIYIFIFGLLLSGGKSYCGTLQHDNISHTATHHFHKNQKYTFNHKNHVGTLTNNVDYDLEEDFSINDEGKTINKNKFLANKYSFKDYFYSTQSSVYKSSHFSKSFKIAPSLCGLSTPIYISLRVLRI